MPLETRCAWCGKTLVDVDHAKKHVAEKCENAPWRKQIDDLAGALKATLPYAESRAEDLTSCADSPEEECEQVPCKGHDADSKASAAKAWAAVEGARALLQEIGRLP